MLIMIITETKAPELCSFFLIKPKDVNIHSRFIYYQTVEESRVFRSNITVYNVQCIQHFS